jgi:cobyrinic acid a,c-diamide synthase
LLVAGLRGGGGKTLLSLGLAASFRSRGLLVAPFKKGPDYIDASWLTRASGRPCRNLDLFLCSPPVVKRSFLEGSKGADVAIIEGNRGLYDGMDPEGSYSSAELAKLLRVPVLLSIDATKTTRTAAALVLGCQTLDPEVQLAGVVLNRVAGERHESVLREAIEEICGIPVLGAIPRLPEDLFPERHLGLVPPQETEAAESPIARVREVAEKHLDLDGILALARKASSGFGDHDLVPTEVESDPVRVVGAPPGARPLPVPQARIGVFLDAAFQFYYPENLEHLVQAGGELVEISPLEDASLPDVDALYLGGGFPETLAPTLAENRSFMASLRDAAEAGLPVYAECGGAVYLGETLHYREETFSLAGVLPVEFGFGAKPRGHGYTVLETVGENPFFSLGGIVRGHEFHYTHMLTPQRERDLRFAFRMRRGYGYDGKHDGLCRKNVLASYTHVHSLGTVDWAPSLVGKAVWFKSRSSA